MCLCLNVDKNRQETEKQFTTNTYADGSIQPSNNI